MSTESSVQKIFSEFWEWRIKEFPEFASSCGIHKYDDRLDDHSITGFQKRAHDAEAFLQRCKVLGGEPGLAEEDRLYLRLLSESLDVFICGTKFEGYLFPINYYEGFQIEFETLTSWMVFNNVDDYKKYLCRLQGIPKRLEQNIEQLRCGIEKGKTYASWSMKNVVDKFKNITSNSIEETVFFEPFKRIPGGIDQSAILPIQKDSQAVIKDQVIPAYQKLGDFIENVYCKALRSKEGISSIPNGAEFYKQCLQFHLSLPMTPEEVHELGKKEVARIRAQMEEIKTKTGFQGDLKSFVQHLRDDDQFYFKSKNDIKQGYEDLCYNKIRPVLPKLFHKIPESKMILEAFPESRLIAPAGFYSPGTFDGSRPGIFYFNASSMRICPKYEMTTMALHEGEPGHHFQFMYAIEATNIPNFRRYMEDMNYWVAPSKFPVYTAYMEGWGLYCEFLGNELGLFEDPYQLFGHLSFEMHRALRLVIDTGLHAFGWSYDQAKSLLMENTALAEGFINNELTRYITWPGQACAYKIGQIKLQELRRKAEKELGDTFDVRDFHEEVLKIGAVPLLVLEEIIEKYIDRVKTK